MSSFAKRITTACVAIPLIVIVIYFLPHYNHLSFAIAVTFASLVGNVEMRHMLEKTGVKVSKLAYLGFLYPIFEYLDYTTEMELFSSSVLYFTALVIGLIFATSIFTNTENNFKNLIPNTSASVLNLIYPGFFAGYMAKLGFLPDATWMIIFYFVLVFGSDSFAYFTGMAFGRNNKGIIKVSPNKSIAGYIGGIFIPALISMAAAMIFPNHFSFSPFAGFLIGFIVSIFAAIGDLIESAFKRSAGVKDSGVAIPGRGGMLDSIDSLVIAAPIFFLLIEYFLEA